jgi:hypothetical protein
MEKPELTGEFPKVVLVSKCPRLQLMQTSKGMTMSQAVALVTLK